LPEKEISPAETSRGKGEVAAGGNVAQTSDWDGKKIELAKPIPNPESKGAFK